MSSPTRQAGIAIGLLLSIGTSQPVTASAGPPDKAADLETTLSRFGCKSEHQLVTHEVTVRCSKPRIEELLPEIREQVPEIKAIPPMLLALAAENGVIVEAILRVSAMRSVVSAFANGDEGPIHLIGRITSYDVYGQNSEKKALEFFMDRKTYEQIDWPHFDVNNLAKVTREWYQEEPGSKDVPIATFKGTGTFTGSLTSKPDNSREMPATSSVVPPTEPQLRSGFRIPRPEFRNQPAVDERPADQSAQHDSQRPPDPQPQGQATIYKLVNASDVAVAPGRYVDTDIELRGMRCFYAQPGEFRCFGGSPALTVFLRRLMIDEAQKTIEERCGTIRNAEHHPGCVVAIRFRYSKGDIGQDRVAFYMPRTTIEADTAEIRWLPYVVRRRR